MLSLILVVIGVSLAAILAVVTLYYGGGSLSEGLSRISAARLVSDGEQIMAAAVMRQAAGHGSPLTLNVLVQEEYLKDIPDPYGDSTTWGWSPESTTLGMVRAVPENVCRHVNSLAYGTSRNAPVTNKVDTRFRVQCYGEAAPYTVIWNPSPSQVLPDGSTAVCAGTAALGHLPAECGDGVVPVLPEDAGGDPLGPTVGITGFGPIDPNIPRVTGASLYLSPSSVMFTLTTREQTVRLSNNGDQPVLYMGASGSGSMTGPIGPGPIGGGGLILSSNGDMTVTSAYYGMAPSNMNAWSSNCPEVLMPGFGCDIIVQPVSYNPYATIEEDLVVMGFTEDYSSPVQASVPVRTDYSGLKLSMVPKALPDTTVGSYYYGDMSRNQQGDMLWTATNAPGFDMLDSRYVTYEVVAGALPPGTWLSPGVVSGDPNTPGTYQFTIRATAFGSSVEQSYQIRVWDASLSYFGLKTWLNGSLPPGRVGELYYVDLKPFYEATDLNNMPVALDPSAIEFQPLMLPPGLKMTRDGNLYGVPTEQGSFWFVAIASYKGYNLYTGLSYFVNLPTQPDPNSPSSPSSSVSVVFPNSLSFPLTAVGETSPSQAVVAVGQSGTTTVTSATVTGPFVVSENSCGAPLAEGAICKIGVAYMPSMVSTSDSGLLIVETSKGRQELTLSGGGARYPLEITTVANDWVTSMAFPNTNVGGSYGKIVMLANTSQYPISLYQPVLAGTIASQLSLGSEDTYPPCNGLSSLAPRGTCQYRVWFKPTAGGSFTGSISFSGTLQKPTGGSAVPTRQLSVSGAATAPTAPEPEPQPVEDYTTFTAPTTVTGPTFTGLGMTGTTEQTWGPWYNIGPNPPSYSTCSSGCESYYDMNTLSYYVRYAQ